MRVIDGEALGVRVLGTALVVNPFIHYFRDN